MSACTSDRWFDLAHESFGLRSSIFWGNFGQLKILIKLTNLLVSINLFKNFEFENTKNLKYDYIRKVHFISYFVFGLVFGRGGVWQSPKLPQNVYVLIIR